MIQEEWSDSDESIGSLKDFVVYEEEEDQCEGEEDEGEEDEEEDEEEDQCGGEEDEVVIHKKRRKFKRLKRNDMSCNIEELQSESSNFLNYGTYKPAVSCEVLELCKMLKDNPISDKQYSLIKEIIENRNNFCEIFIKPTN